MATGVVADPSPVLAAAPTDEPPILRGEAAEVNLAKRALRGRYTEEDMRLHRWCLTKLPWESVMYGMHRLRYITYLGEKIWPPE